MLYPLSVSEMAGVRPELAQRRKRDIPTTASNSQFGVSSSRKRSCRETEVRWSAIARRMGRRNRSRLDGVRRAGAKKAVQKTLPSPALLARRVDTVAVLVMRRGSC